MWIFVILFLINLSWVNFKLAAVPKIPAKILTAKATIPKIDPDKANAPVPVKTISSAPTKIITPEPITTLVPKTITPVTPTKNSPVAPVPAKTVTPAPAKTVISIKNLSIVPVSPKTLMGQQKLGATVHDFMITATTALPVTPILCPVTQTAAPGCLTPGITTDAEATCCSGHATDGSVGVCLNGVTCTSNATCACCPSSDTCECMPAPSNTCIGLGLKSCVSVVGQSCANHSDCLSNKCLNNICCAQTNGDFCDSGCSYVIGQAGSCVNGQWSCAVVAVNGSCTCLATGATCTTTPTCCPLTTGNVCVSGKCAPCASNSGICAIDSDCCSNNCQNSKCVAQIVGDICDNNSGCSSDICANNLCQAAPVGGNCAINSDCISNICTLDKYCACALESGSCTQDSSCCGDLSCINGSCNCLTIGQACVSSNQCCEGSGTGGGGAAHLACSVVGSSKICQAVAGCPESLGLDLAQIHSFFMGEVSNPTVASQCLIAYELLIYNYTIFAQYATLVSNGTIACAGTANPEFQATLTKLTNNIYHNLVVLQASCFPMNPIGNGYNVSNPPFNLSNGFNATAPVNQINQTHANSLTTAATVISSLQPDQAVINQIAQANYPQALQWGNFANTNCGSGITSCCQPSTSSTSCTCEAVISANNPSATCISATCCVGDVSLDLASNASSMIVVTVPTLTAANAAVVNPNSNPDANYLIVPGATMVSASSLVNTDGTVNPVNIYACTADRFLSLVNCWLAILPTSCPQ